MTALISVLYYNSIVTSVTGGVSLCNFISFFGQVIYFLQNLYFYIYLYCVRIAAVG